MPRGAGLAPGEQEAVVRPVRVRGPHLLAGDHEVVPVEDGARGQIGEIAAGIGLGEALAPDLVGVEDGLEPALLLRGGAVHHEGRRHHAEADGVHAGRGPGRDQLLGEDELLDEGDAAPPELLRPAESHPAARVHAPVPGPAGVEGPVGVKGQLVVGGRMDLAVRGQVGGQPRAQLGAERRLRGRIGKVHGGADGGYGVGRT